MSRPFDLIRIQSMTSEEPMPKLDPIAYTRTIRKQQLKEMVPLADSTIFEMEQRGAFPRHYALSPRPVVCNLAAAETWIEHRTHRPHRRPQSVDYRDRTTTPIQ